MSPARRKPPEAKEPEDSPEKLKAKIEEYRLERRRLIFMAQEAQAEAMRCRGEAVTAQNFVQQFHREAERVLAAAAEGDPEEAMARVQVLQLYCHIWIEQIERWRKDCAEKF